MTYSSRPERKGYRLTEEGEQSYQNWLDLGGCICFTGCAPCHVCVDEGHPISLEETDEVWEPDTKFKKGDEIECISSLGRIGVGEKFLVVDSRPQLSAPSFHPELVYIEVDGVVRNYSPKHFELVKEGGNDEMSRSDVVNVKENVSSPQGSPHPVYYTSGSSLDAQGRLYGLCRNHGRTVESDEHFRQRIIEKMREDEKSQPETKKEFKGGYWYKCTDSSSKTLRLGKYYKFVGISYADTGKFEDELGNHLGGWNYTRFDVNSESSFNPLIEVTITRATDIKEKVLTAANHVHQGLCKEVKTSGVYECTLTKQTEEKQTMSNANNRRIVTVQVFDLDPALDVEHSLVHVFENVVTEDTNDVTLTELLHTGQLVDPLAAHNKIRTAQDNKDILSRTGKKVKLEAIKVKNLHFKYI